MENIEWLTIAEDATAKKVDMDKPYAWWNDRIYTRREFEAARDRVEETRKYMCNALLEKRKNDKQLFFENLDNILAHSDLILADKELSGSRPIDFRISVRWVGVMSYNLGFVLQNWLNGSWKRECPDCGESSYLFSFYERKGYVYCPLCKKILEVDVPDDVHKAQVSEIFAIRRARKEKAEKESAEAEKTETAAAQNQVKEIKEPTRFEMAKKYGLSIGYWNRQIEENEARLKDYEDIKQGRKLSEVGKFLARLKELAQSCAVAKS